MEKLFFGTAGVPLSAKDKSSIGGIERVFDLDLGCMELEFVNGVRMGEKTAQLVGAKAREKNIRLSVHGPYCINLNSKEQEKIEASRQRIVHSARIGEICGAQSVIFHPAFNHDDSPEVVLDRVVEGLRLVREELKSAGITMTLRPETTGKSSQFGDLEEVIKVSQQVEGVLPCIDFGHLHARTNGAYNTYEEFCGILKSLEDGLGREALDNVHFHLSGIAYSAKGERNHLVLDESDFNYKELLKAFKVFDVKGLIICESPRIEEDAMKLRDFYYSL